MISSTDQPIPHGEIMDYSHIEHGERRLEIADYVGPELTMEVIRQRITERQERGE